MKFEIEFVSVKDRLPTEKECALNNQMLCVVEISIGNGESAISYKTINCDWSIYMNKPRFNVDGYIVRAWAVLPNIKGLSL